MNYYVKCDNQPLSSLQVTIVLCLNSGKISLFTMRIQLLSMVRAARNGPSTSGLPFAQLEYWTYVPSYHFIRLSTAEQNYY